MGKPKSYAELISDAQVMATGLKTHLDELKKRGMTEEFITALEATLNNAIAKNNEQEKLKADLKVATVALDSMLTDMSASMTEAVNVVKLTLPQPQWIEFGITAKR
ncbi:MAG: hypothetical protein LBR81_00055 [Prevotellaceae bacterium]|jgi:hypothetical protein|nr:hypothetical protein [Prevotellaceae bacterium]